MAQPTIKVPIVPQWNLVAGCVPTPDQGFLYVGSKTINYISQIKGNEAPPTMKIFHTRQTIKGLDCDSDWTVTRYFAILAQDNSVQIWDFDQAKAVFGHKAHFTKPHTEGDGPSSPDGVHMSFMTNRNILSICSDDLVIYCVPSNTYCRRQRIIPKKYQLSIIKCSPYDEHIFAAGTAKGLVIVADLKTEQILYTLKGHDACVTSLAWNVIRISSGAVGTDVVATVTPMKEQSKRKPEAKNLMAADDIFDIYDYDYLENEFGAPTDNKQNLEQFEGNDKNQEDGNNTNFNYVEACESLKEEIDALKNQPNNTSDPQVTLEDCHQVDHRADESSSCDSNNSVELLDKSSSDDTTNKEKLVLQHQAEVHTQEEKEVEQPKPPPVTAPQSPGKMTVIASAGADAAIWIWNAKTGAACDKLKGRTVPHGKNNHIESAWISPSTLLVTSRSGTITSFSLDPQKLGKFKEDKKDFSQQAVVSLCRSRSAPLLWTISSYREIICENLETNQIVAKYSCASTNIVAMCERPDDMNKIAIAFSDRRIGIIDISKITPTNVSIENFTSKIDSQVFALAWSPASQSLAFGTNEGRVGVLQTDNPKASPFIFHPVCGKPVYSMDWKNKYIYVCCNEKVALYPENMQQKDPIVLEYITGASAISVCSQFLFVGTQNGNVEIFKEKTGPQISYDLIRNLEIGPRYITNIAWSPINTSRFAVASMWRKIRVFNFNEADGTASIARDIDINTNMAANGCIKWSNRRENMLLASGFDGAMRVWDLNSKRDDEFFLKQFQSPMSCGLFLPSDENIVMCAGRATSIEMFNMLLENTQKYSSVKWKKQKMKTLDSVQWGTKITGIDGKAMTAAEKRDRRKKKNKIGGDDETQNDFKADADKVSGMLTKLQLDEKEKENGIGGSCKDCSMFSKSPSTILYLTTKEINKDCLDKLKNMLDSPKEKYRMLCPKLCGTKADAKRLLEEEIRNQQGSEVRSISSILAFQVNSNLQQEILKRVETKTLSEWHVSLAPTVSFMFWRKCCQAFANQLIEQGHILQATTYLLALHDTRQAITILLEKQFFKEALIIAKVHCQPDDEIVEEITNKWVTHFESVGNLASAAYICAASGKLQKAHNILCRTRNVTPELQEVINKIREKTMKI